MVQLQPQYRSEIVRLNKTLQMNSEYSHCKYWHSAFKKDPKQRLLAHSIAQMDSINNPWRNCFISAIWASTAKRIIIYYEGLRSLASDRPGRSSTYISWHAEIYWCTVNSVHCTVHCTVAELAWWHCTEAYHCTIITAITRHLSHQKTINSFLKGWDQHWNVLHCEKLWGFRETSTLVFHCAA